MFTSEEIAQLRSEVDDAPIVDQGGTFSPDEISTLRSEIYGKKASPEDSHGYIGSFARGVVRGSEAILSGVGSATRWFGDIADAPLISGAGKTASTFWEEAAQHGWEAPDPAIFGKKWSELSIGDQIKRGVGVIGEAAPSLAIAMATGYAVTGSAIRAGMALKKAQMYGGGAAAGGLGVLEGAPQYEESREAGKDLMEATMHGGLSTVGTAVLEYLPISRFLKGIPGGVVVRGVKGAATEAAQEASQTIWQNAIAKYGYDDTRSLAEGIIEAIIGGAGMGGIAGAVFKKSGDIVEKHNIPEDEVKEYAKDLSSQIKTADAELSAVFNPRKAPTRTVPSGIQKQPAEEKDESIGYPSGFSFLIFARSGKPFKTKGNAVLSMKKDGIAGKVITVPGGFAIRPDSPKDTPSQAGEAALPEGIDVKFVKDKVESLGSVEAVERLYSDDDAVSSFARKYSEEFYKETPKPEKAPEPEDPEAKGKEPWKTMRKGLSDLRDRLAKEADAFNVKDESFPSSKYDPEVKRIDALIDSGDLVNKKANILKGQTQSKLKELFDSDVDSVLKDYPELSKPKPPEAKGKEPTIKPDTHLTPAFKLENGEIVVGEIHANAFDQMTVEEQNMEMVEGYATPQGVFITNAQAKELHGVDESGAIAKKQFTDKFGEEPPNKDYSEVVGDDEAPPEPKAKEPWEVTGDTLGADRPRTFFRGTVPGSTKKIKEPFSAAKGKTFVARKESSAKNYGEQIEKIKAKPDAKILYDEDPAFWKLIKRRKPPNGFIGSATRKGETVIDLVNKSITSAQVAGYDAISFSSDADIGTVILNDNAFVRDSAQVVHKMTPEPWEMTRNEYRATVFGDAKTPETIDAKIQGNLEKIGERTITEVGDDHPGSIVRHYAKKYNLGKIPLKPKGGLRRSGNGIASTATIRNQAGQAIGRAIVVDAEMIADKTQRNHLAGALRHEIEHLRDNAVGYEMTEAQNRLNAVGIMADIEGGGDVSGVYAKHRKGHHKKHDVFETDFLHKRLVEKAISSGKIDSHPDYPDLTPAKAPEAKAPTAGKANVAKKDPATMTAGQINKELDKIEKSDSKFTDEMIAAGRGGERYSDWSEKTDPLSLKMLANSERRYDLRREIELRYGPNPPSRLPTRGFRPRKKAPKPVAKPKPKAPEAKGKEPVDVKKIPSNQTESRAKRRDVADRVLEDPEKAPLKELLVTRGYLADRMGALQYKAQQGKAYNKNLLDSLSREYHGIQRLIQNKESKPKPKAPTKPKKPIAPKEGEGKALEDIAKDFKTVEDLQSAYTRASMQPDMVSHGVGLPTKRAKTALEKAGASIYKGRTTFDLMSKDFKMWQGRGKKKTKVSGIDDFRKSNPKFKDASDAEIQKIVGEYSKRASSSIEKAWNDVFNKAHAKKTVKVDMPKVDVGFEWETKTGKRKIVGKKKISAAEIETQDGIKKIPASESYEVQNPNSKFLELIDTTEIEAEIARDTKNLESQKKRDASFAEQEEKQKAIDKEYRDIDGFLDDLPEFRRATVLKTLNKHQNYDRKLYRRKDFIRERVNKGYVVKGNGKSRTFVSPDNAFYDNLTKTELDYAEYLMGKQPTPSEQYQIKSGKKDAKSTVQKRDALSIKGRSDAIRYLEKSLAERTGREIPEGTIRTVIFHTKTQRGVKAVARAFQVDVVFIKSKAGLGFNGITFSNLPDTIFVNADSKNPLLAVAGHEVFHTLQIQHPDLHKELIKNLSAKTLRAKFSKYLDRLNFSRKQAGMPEANEIAAYNEFLGDFLGDQFLDPKFWDKLNKQDPTFTNKLAKIVSKIINKIKNVARRFLSEDYFNDISEAQDVLAEVMARYAKRQKTGKKSADTEILYQFAQDASLGLRKAVKFVKKIPAFQKWIGKAKVVKDKDGNVIYNPTQTFYHGTPFGNFAKSAMSVNAKRAVVINKRKEILANRITVWDMIRDEPLGRYTENERTAARDLQKELDKEERGLPSIEAHKRKIGDVFRFVGVNDEGYLGQGFYFSPNMKGAKGWANASSRPTRPGEKREPYIYEVFLKMENPFHDGSPYTKEMAEYERNEYDRQTYGLRGDIDRMMTARAVARTQTLKKFGYDGVIGEVKGGQGQGLEYVVFNPTQIKSIYNRGTFSETDPDIMYQVSEPAEKRYAKRQTEGRRSTDTGILYQAQSETKAAKNVMDNPAFREWFGDSNVVDEDGEPLVVYHGAGEQFEEFRHGWSAGHIWGRGFYFTESEADAGHYAEISSRKTGEQNIIPAYLSIENPLYLESDSFDGNIVDGLPSDFRSKLLGELDPEYDQEMIDALNGEYIEDSEIEKYAKDIQDYAEEFGHDGIIGTYSGDTHYMAFHPTQIKSIYNRGTFSESDPNIMYQVSEPAEKWYSQMTNFFAEKLPGKANPFEGLKDEWIGEKDTKVHNNMVEAAVLQDELRKTLGFKTQEERKGPRTPRAKFREDRISNDMEAAIHIYLDLKRNPSHLKKYYDDLPDKWKKIVDLSQTVESNPELVRIANHIDNAYKEAGKQALEDNAIRNLVENYVGRAWKQLKKTRSATETLSKFKTKTRHAKHRVLGTILEGLALKDENGDHVLDLQITGAINNLQLYKDEIARVVEDKKLIDAGRKTEWMDTGHKLIEDTPPRGMDYVEIEHPNFVRWEYAANVDLDETDVDEKTGLKVGDFVRAYDRDNIGKVESITPETVTVHFINKEKGTEATKTFDIPEVGSLEKTLRKVQPRGKNFVILDDGTILERRKLYAPKEVADRLNKMLGTSKLRGKHILGIPIDTVTKYNAIFKSMILITSFFHHLAFMRSYLFGTKHKSLEEWRPVKSYKQGLKAVKEYDRDVELLVRNGLTLGRVQDWEESVLREEDTALGKIFDKVAMTPKIRETLNKLRQWQADFLFGNFGAGLKAKAGLIELRNLRKRHPELPEAEQAKIVASLINDDFGGLHLQRMERDPTTQHIMRLFLLASDWTESNVRTMVKAVKAGSKEEREMYRRFWSAVLTKGIGATVLANLFMAMGDDDDFMERYRKAWKAGNFRWMDVDITPIHKMLGGDDETKKYFSILGHFKDPVKFLVHPVRSLHHKGSVVYRTFHEAMGGTDWRGHRFTTLSELTGIDDKGNYLTTSKTHKFGDPKGGKLAGKTTHYAGKKGPIGIPQIPSYLINQIKGVQPIQVQNLLAWAQGETSGFDALARSAGLHSSTTYPTDKRMMNDFVERYMALRTGGKSLANLRKSVMLFNKRQKGKTDGMKIISWKKLRKKGDKLIRAEKKGKER